MRRWSDARVVRRVLFLLALVSFSACARRYADAPKEPAVDRGSEPTSLDTLTMRRAGGPTRAPVRDDHLGRGRGFRGGADC